jgi:hypothetical protein
MNKNIFLAILPLISLTDAFANPPATSFNDLPLEMVEDQIMSRLDTRDQRSLASINKATSEMKGRTVRLNMDHHSYGKDPEKDSALHRLLEKSKYVFFSYISVHDFKSLEPYLKNVSGLTIRGGEAGIAQEVAQSASLTQLTFLYLMDCHVDNAGAEAIAKSPYLQNLRDLSLTSNMIGDEGGLAIVTHLKHLKGLNFYRNPISPEGQTTVHSHFPMAKF